MLINDHGTQRNVYELHITEVRGLLKQAGYFFSGKNKQGDQIYLHEETGQRKTVYNNGTRTRVLAGTALKTLFEGTAILPAHANLVVLPTPQTVAEPQTPVAKNSPLTRNEWRRQQVLALTACA